MYHLLYATSDGLMYNHPDMAAAGGAGGSHVFPLPEGGLIPLPEGSSLVLVPDGTPLGYRRGKEGAFSRTPDGKPALAVAACLPQGFTRTCLPAYRRKSARPLPILGYTAVAWRDGRVYAAALPTDDPGRWSPRNYNTPALSQLVKERLAAPPNTVLAGLARCALEYRCFTAQNIFYRRWEGGLPTTPACNARCLGCLSAQEKGGPPAPQTRITCMPPLAEVTAVGVEHLSRATEPIVSFGQGCEGEPLLSSPFLAQAIRAMRRQTPSGTINLNSNAGHTAGLAAVIDAGLDSLRVSLASATPAVYTSYHRPAFRLADVRNSITLAVRAGVYTSLNLLVFPGLTDCPTEIAALLDLIRETGLHMVQLRNLNIDPAVMMPLVPAESPLGIGYLIDRLKEVPGLAVGNFSRARRDPGKREGRVQPAGMTAGLPPSIRG